MQKMNTEKLGLIVLIMLYLVFTGSVITICYLSYARLKVFVNKVNKDFYRNVYYYQTPDSIIEYNR